MGVPADDGKLAFAVGLAAGLAYIALRHSNPVRAVVLADQGASKSSLLFLYFVVTYAGELRARSGQSPTRSCSTSWSA